MHNEAIANLFLKGKAAFRKVFDNTNLKSKIRTFLNDDDAPIYDQTKLNDL